MLSSLPSLAPRDSHALWYTSSHNSSNPTTHQEPVSHAFDHLASLPGQNGSLHTQRRSTPSATQRTPLAKLRADEQYMERRKQNVQNYGSSWIKPPGVPKTLHQMSEERREMEEHQEALRREQLAQELAEAEGANELLLQGEGADGEMEAGRDLDDEIPEADATGVDAGDSTSDEESDEESVNEQPGGTVAMLRPANVFREARVRGEEGLDTGFGEDAGSATDEDEQSGMLREDDLVRERPVRGEREGDMGMDLDADLDNDIPEAEGYEHTDTEADLSTSEDDDSVDMGRLPLDQPLNVSMVRSDGTQNSMDLSAMDLRSGSSMMGSSPWPRGNGRSRRDRLS